MSKPLIFNPKNAVTRSIERVHVQDRSAVRKVLSTENREDTPNEWRASPEAHHWNYWLREARVYQSEVGVVLRRVGMRLPEVFDLQTQEREAVLVLEDLVGRTGHTLSWDDFERIAHE